MAIPNPLFLYRMVHWKNMEHILKNGLCCVGHANADSNYINIGHQKLISDRHNYPIDLPNAGNLGEYVPFYFSGHSPMLLKIVSGRDPRVEQMDQQDIVFIVIDVKAVKTSGVEYVFTDRNAKIKFANYYTNSDDLAQLKWDIICSKDWKNTEHNLQRQDYKQAEFLIRRYVPVELIHTLVVKSDIKKQQIHAIVRDVGLQIPVVVARPGKLYY